MTKYTLVTGASSGIGYELAKVFARNKHNLILVARSVDKLNALKEELESTYQTVVEVLPSDLSLTGSAEKLFETIQHKKIEVDILVNNAGFGAHGSFIKSELKNTQEMIHLNIVTLTELTKLFLPKMIERKSGYILNVASTAAFQPGPLMTVYYATKAFVLSFSEGLFEELKNTGVSVTALCPGPTESGFMEAANLKNVPLVNTMKLPSSKAVAEYGYAALMNKKAVAVHGVLNRVMSSSVGLFPRAMVRKLVMKLQESKR